MERVFVGNENPCLSVCEKTRCAFPGYESLCDVFSKAIARAATGKGKERHASPGEKFEDQLKDIQLFKENHVLKQADNVVKLHTAIRHLEREKIQYALQLAYSHHQILRLEPKLFDKKEREENNKETLLKY